MVKTEKLNVMRMSEIKTKMLLLLYMQVYIGQPSHHHLLTHIAQLLHNKMQYTRIWLQNLYKTSLRDRYAAYQQLSNIYLRRKWIIINNEIHQKMCWLRLYFVNFCAGILGRYGKGDGTVTLYLNEYDVCEARATLLSATLSSFQRLQILRENCERSVWHCGADV